MYEKIAFEKSQFDKIDWHPIDDQLITHIHRTANVLPCSFPPTGYYESKRTEQSTIESNAKTKTPKTCESAFKSQIKPKDDFEWVAKRSENRKKVLSKPQHLNKSKKNAAKRQKQKVKLLLKKAQKTVDQMEANELASVRKISVDEYTAVDKPIEPTPNITKTVEPRQTRKRFSQNFAAEKIKSVDIANAQSEILKRRALSYTTAKPMAMVTADSIGDSSTESNTMVKTRSGRVLRSRQK